MQAAMKDPQVSLCFADRLRTHKDVVCNQKPRGSRQS